MERRGETENRMGGKREIYREKEGINGEMGKTKEGRYTWRRGEGNREDRKTV